MEGFDLHHSPARQHSALANPHQTFANIVLTRLPATASNIASDAAVAAILHTGGCDNTAQLWNLQTSQVQQVASHREPVRHLGYLEEVGLLVTASWDRTLQYWDLRQPQATNTVSLPERVYAFSLAYPLLVLGLANRHIQVAHTLQQPALERPSVMCKACTSTSVITSMWSSVIRAAGICHASQLPAATLTSWTVSPMQKPCH